jgi:nitrous oxidase accessory protein NosD
MKGAPLHGSALRRALVGIAMVAMLATFGAADAFAWNSHHHGHTVIVRSGDSIQAAVDAAKPGTTILVFGHHAENVAITTNGIKLRGIHAVLTPPATPTHNACFDPTMPTDVNGICVLGDVNMSTGVVNRPVSNVTIIGFKISGFSDSGIVALGAHNAKFTNDVALNNGSYGITAFSSTDTQMSFNRASGSGEAGFYIGDSPMADAHVFGNKSTNSLFGLLVRNAEHASVTGNRFHNNCVGMVVLADAPGPAGNVNIVGNRITNNTKACAAGEDVPFPLSGVGIGLVGAHDVLIRSNWITGNTPSAATQFQGGVLIVSGMGGTAPMNNTVRHNVIRNNDPDVFWDGTGTGNVVTHNLCHTSTPSSLCT